MDQSVILLLLAWAIAAASPGPATLAISGTAMEGGRRAGLSLAAGVVGGSAAWGVAAALGVSAVMTANAWLFEIVRYMGAAYLLFLAIKSLRSGLRPKVLEQAQPETARYSRLFAKGLLLHLTNPKAILAWGAIYAIALPVGAPMIAVWQLFGCLIAVSMVVFLGYALLFSTGGVSRGYQSLRRWFDLGFAALFGAASVRILTARLGE